MLVSVAAALAAAAVTAAGGVAVTNQSPAQPVTNTALPAQRVAVDVNPVKYTSSAVTAGTDGVVAGTTAKATKASIRSTGRHRSGMWVWTWDNPNAVVAFAKARNVSDIYIYNNPIDPQQQQQSIALAIQTRAAGLKPVAMGGDPSWVTNIPVAVGWARTATATGVYEGIHLDVEAHSGPTWAVNKKEAIAQYVKCVQQVNAATPLPVDVSVPWWYHEETFRNASVTDAVAKRADIITLVTYHNTVEGINEFAAKGAAIATKHKTPFRFASETNSGPDIPDWLTFARHTSSSLAATQATVVNQWAANKYFVGFATHDYTGWKALPNDGVHD